MFLHSLIAASFLVSLANLERKFDTCYRINRENQIYFFTISQKIRQTN